MQKKLIAMAVAGLVSGAAFAQSNVTIYGVADAYYGYVKAGDAKVNPAINSGGLAGSRLGFKGAEDLGNGLKAVFQYELGFNLDSTGGTVSPTSHVLETTNGNGLNSTRQSYVGLAGGFGTVVAGRLQAPGYYTSKFDALAASKISPQAILSEYGMGSTISPSNLARLNNAAAYISPDFGGFSGVLAYSAGEQATPIGADRDKESVWGLGLNYAAGPLAVGFVHHNVKNLGTVEAVDIKENLIGASFDLGMVKLLGSYQDQKVADSSRNNLWQVGAVAPVGPGNIHFAYGKTKIKATDEADNSKSWTLAYTYGLSKRTTLYTGYNRTTNDEAASVGILGVGPGAGKKSTGFVAGVNHSF